MRTDREIAVRGIEGTLQMTASGQLVMQGGEWLMREGVLRAGTNRFAWTVELPAELPPTHSLQPHEVDCVATVIVRRAGVWRRDVKVATAIRVRRRPTWHAGRGDAVRARSSNDATRVEVMLPARRYALGERIEGSVVLHRIRAGARELEMLLVPQFVWAGVATAGFATVQRIGLVENGVGTPLPFRFEIPSWVAPSHQWRSLEIRWVLKLRVPTGFSSLEAELPIEIVDEESLATLGPLPEPDAPMNQLSAREDLAAFAARGEGWEPDDTSIDLVGDDGRFLYSTTRAGLRRRRGPYVERLTCAYGTDGELQLLIVLDGPSLGLDLDVRTRTRFERPRGPQVLLGHEWWDRMHLVSARDAGQAQPPARMVLPILVELAQLGFVGVLVSWTDTRVVFEQTVRNLPSRLAPATEALARLRHALEEARSLVVVPRVEIDHAAWRELARSLGTEPVTGDLTIRGTRRETPVWINLTWIDGSPTYVNALVGDPEIQDELDASVIAEHVHRLPNWVEDFGVRLRVARARVAVAGNIDVMRAGELVEYLCNLVAPATLYR